MTFFTVRTNLSTYPFALAHFGVTLRRLKPRSSANDAKSLLLKGGPLSDFITCGTLNSENTLSSFGITVAVEVDFTISTTGYLEQSSVIRRRYSLFGISAKSTLTSFHGAAGSGDIRRGSLLHSGAVTKHASHDFTLLSTSLSMMGNITFSRNNDFVFTRPWCPSCARLTTCSRRLLGMTMRVLRKMRLPDALTVSSYFTLSRRWNSTVSTQGHFATWCLLPSR